jgi:hypothetical protein
MERHYTVMPFTLHGFRGLPRLGWIRHFSAFRVIFDSEIIKLADMLRNGILTLLNGLIRILNHMPRNAILNHMLRNSIFNPVPHY